MAKKILIVLAAALILIQFWPVEHEAPEITLSETLAFAAAPPEDVQAVLTKACMDCHSFKTQYPWYSYVAPVSIWVDDHIQEGRGHLNFSKWNTYSAKKKDHKLEELIEEVKEGEMPLKSYTWGHSEARLSEEEKQLLITWAENLRETGKF